MCTPSKTESKGKPKSKGRGKPNENADMYRRQLGGTQAALRREQQRVKELEAENDALRAIIAGRYSKKEPTCTK